MLSRLMIAMGQNEGLERKIPNGVRKRDKEKEEEQFAVGSDGDG
jgi:hypothetical protein